MHRLIENPKICELKTVSSLRVSRIS